MPFEKGQSGNPKGRPRGARNKSTGDVKDLIDKVGEDFGGMEMVVGRLFDLARGVLVEQADKNEGRSVFSKPPDTLAARILMEYRFGKPTQRIQDDATETFEDWLRKLKDPDERFPVCLVPPQER